MCVANAQYKEMFHVKLKGQYMSNKLSIRYNVY